MGVVLVSNLFFDNEQDAEMLFTCFDWLKREHKAHYTEITTWEDRVYNRMRFAVEGDEEIPKGSELFSVLCTPLVEGVLCFEIDKTPI